MVAPLIVAAAFPLGTLASLLLMGGAGGGGGGGGGQTPVNPVNPPHPSPFPPGSTLATVNVTTGQNGMNIRSAPSPTATLLGSVANGTTVAVIQQGIAEQGAAAGSVLEWWQIQTAAGVKGYSRAVGPQGEHNFTLQGGGGGMANLPDQPQVDPNAPTIAGAYPFDRHFHQGFRRHGHSANPQIYGRPGLGPWSTSYSPYGSAGASVARATFSGIIPGLRRFR